MDGFFLNSIIELNFECGTMRYVFQCLSLSDVYMFHCTPRLLSWKNGHFMPLKQWNSSNRSVNFEVY